MLKLGYYETPRFGFGMTARYGGRDGEHGRSGVSHASLGLGGRYFFAEGDWAPFAGAGFALSTLEVNDADAGRSLEGSGLGAFAEVGVEFLRLHKSRVMVSLRVDAPFYSLDDEYGYMSATGSDAERGSRYQLPVTLGAAYAW